MGENFEVLKTSFWIKFSSVEICDDIGTFAETVYNENKDSVEAVAALVTVLNHKCWYWYYNHNEALSQIYSDLYYKYNDNAWNWLEKNGTDEERHWYFETLD